MADRNVEIRVPGAAVLQQTYKDLGDGSHAPVVVGPSLVIALTIANGAALSEAFDMSEVIQGQVHVPAVWTAANIGFKMCDTIDGTYDIVLDDTGVPQQISNVNTGRAGWYALPSKIFSSKFVKLWSKNTTAATETDTNQAADRALKVVLK